MLIGLMKKCLPRYGRQIEAWATKRDGHFGKRTLDARLFLSLGGGKFHGKTATTRRKAPRGKK